MAETAQRRSPTPLIDVVGPGRSETHMFSNWPILITLSWYRRRHLNLEVLKVLVCRVTLSLATTHGVALTSCLFPRGGMLCPAPSRHAPSNHITDMFHKAPPRRAVVACCKQASDSGERSIWNSELDQSNPDLTLL